MRGFQRTLTTAVLIATVGIVFASGTAQAKKFEVLESFGGHKLGSTPQGSVLIDKDGNTFGTASQEGPQGGGTVFELKHVRHGYKASSIFRFNRVDGENPTGALIMDTQGNLYGLANNIAFELSPVAGQRIWSETILHQFCSQQNCTDGNGPVGGLTYQGASSGALYDGVSPLFGVTDGGGANNKGTAFQLNNDNGWQETVLYSFCSTGGSKCTDGAQPAAGVILDQAGNLFGTTKFGGGNGGKSHRAGAGLVYELISTGDDAWQQTILYRFCSLSECADGAIPFAPLIMDSTGNLLGTTGFGGRKCHFSKASGCGTIFKVTSNGSNSQETVLYAFCAKRNCSDGLNPQAGLSMDRNGNLFGTTDFGGGNIVSQFPEGGGTVFEFSDAGLQVLHAFCSQANCVDGAEPIAGVTIDSSGQVYGTATFGGEFGEGVSFKEAP